MNGSRCAVCEGHWPLPANRIAECDVSTAYLFEDQFFAGWTVVVLNRHAVELFALSVHERTTLIEDVNRVASALAAVFQPVKMNYELLGNQVPHIHWHLVPRLTTDPAPHAPVWTVEHPPRRLEATEALARIERIRRALYGS